MRIILDEKAQQLLLKKLAGPSEAKKCLFLAFRERRNCCGAGFCEWIAITLEDVETCAKYERVDTIEPNVPVFVDDVDEFSTYLMQDKLEITTRENGPVEVFALA
ncbi:MAG: hypothetical protein ACTSRW_13355 [Candidatus Helarchaeota archaeon]